MKPEALLCPKCHQTLMTPQIVRQHVKIATTAQHHITIHQVDCPKCNEKYGLIFIADRKKYLVVLVGPERLRDEVTAISQQMLGGGKIAQLWQTLNKNHIKAAVLGKRGTCRHSWKFRQLHPLGFIQLVCPKCGGQREEALTAVNLVRFVLRPYSEGDEIIKRQKDIIESAILPRKHEIIAEAAKELDRRLKMNERRRLQLKTLRKFCNTAALVT